MHVYVYVCDCQHMRALVLFNLGVFVCTMHVHLLQRTPPPTLLLLSVYAIFLEVYHAWPPLHRGLPVTQAAF